MFKAAAALTRLLPKRQCAIGEHIQGGSSYFSMRMLFSEDDVSAMPVVAPCVDIFPATHTGSYMEDSGNAVAASTNIVWLGDGGSTWMHAPPL